MTELDMIIELLTVIIQENKEDTCTYLHVHKSKRFAPKITLGECKRISDMYQCEP